MINKNEIFTFTLLDRDDDDKVILIQKGDVPAKSEEEADTVLSIKNDDEKDTVDKLISKLFKHTEPGSEESITASLEEFENKYDISLEEFEEDTGKDLDNDVEEEESEKHADKVDTDTADEDLSNISDMPKPDKDNVAIISIHSLTDPSEILHLQKHSEYTTPIDYLEEELPEEVEIYDPLLFEQDSQEDEDLLEEGATPQELIKKFLDLARTTKRGIFTTPAITELFNVLHVTDPDAKFTALRTALDTGNIKLYFAPSSTATEEPILAVAGATEMLPSNAVEISPNDATKINFALSKFVGKA